MGQKNIGDWIKWHIMSLGTPSVEHVFQVWEGHGSKCYNGSIRRMCIHKTYQVFYKMSTIQYPIFMYNIKKEHVPKSFIQNAHPK